MLNVHSIFKSIQGEGQLIGLPMVFVRLSGCPLRCRWCDSEDSRESRGEVMDIDQIIEKVQKSSVTAVCLTGGEPLAQSGSITLMNRLVDSGFLIQLETSGALPIEEVPCTEQVMISMDIKCPSSGMDNRMKFTNIELLSPFDQIKFVVQDERDYEYAKKTIEKFEPKCPVIMTPVGGVDMKFLAEKVLRERLNVRVLPQLNKIIWGVEPDR